jgi:WD40 repeat protein
VPLYSRTQKWNKPINISKYLPDNLLRSAVNDYMWLPLTLSLTLVADNQTIQTILHPCTVWACTFIPRSGDLVTAGSDGVVRVWSRDASKHAPPEVQKAYNDKVENQTISKYCFRSPPPSFCWVVRRSRVLYAFQESTRGDESGIAADPGVPGKSGQTGR